MNKYWALVLISGLVEIIWATLLKAADSVGLWLLAFALISLTFVFLFQANKHLPVGTVYAIFTGIGTGGTVIVGIIFFGESFSIVKLLLIALLLAGVFGLKLFTDKDSHDPKKQAALKNEVR